MADWTAFAVATAVLTLLLLFMTHRSQQLLEQVTVVDDRETLTERRDVGGGEPTHFDDREAVEREVEHEAVEREAVEREEPTPVRDEETVAGDEPKQTELTEPDESPEDVQGDRADLDEGDVVDRPGRVEGDVVDRADLDEGESIAAREASDAAPPEQFFTTRLLLLNVLLSQGVFLIALVGLAWWTDVPASAFGIELATIDSEALAIGLVAGVALYVANAVVALVGEQFGFSAPEALRSAMAPTNGAEWALLLVVVLPTIAVFEEVLFRGALIGVVSVGFGLDPWLLVVASSVVFGLGHGAQGRLGILVTGGLGVVLASVFVVTGNLFVVIVAHYVINALEFVIQEGIEWEPISSR